MDEQYFINEELLDILHECGMVKTEKELIKEKEQEEKALKEEEAKKQKGDNEEEFDGECPVAKELEDIRTSIDSLTASLATMNDCMHSYGKILKAILTVLKDND